MLQLQKLENLSTIVIQPFVYAAFIMIQINVFPQSPFFSPQTSLVHVSVTSAHVSPFSIHLPIAGLHLPPDSEPPPPTSPSSLPDRHPNAKFIQLHYSSSLFTASKSLHTPINFYGISPNAYV